jgi:hypothetical protein
MRSRVIVTIGLLFSSGCFRAARPVCNPYPVLPRSALAWGPNIFDRDDPATLRGRVVNAQTGQPIVGARVLLEPMNKQLSTDSAGRFAIATLPHGDYIITIMGDYTRLRETITIAMNGLRIHAALATGAGIVDGACFVAKPLRG